MIKSTLLAWLCLVGAGCCQTAWTYSLKYIQWPHQLAIRQFAWDKGSQIGLLAWISYFVFGAINSILLSIAMRSLSPSSTFIVWTGFSLLFMSVCDAFLYTLVWSFSKLFFIGLILVGIIGLKVFS